MDAMSTIYFIRHGQASFGSEDYDRLSDIGREQSERLGHYLAGIETAFDAVFSGSLRRQTETAEIVMSTLKTNGFAPPVAVVSDFDEYDSSGVFKALAADMIEEDPGLSHRLKRILSDPKDFQRIFEKMVNRWVAGRHRCPVAESWQAFTRRVRRGVADVMDACGAGKQIAVFTSAGALSAVMQMALGLSDERAVGVSWVVYNSAVSVFRYNRRKHLGLSTFNSIAHLESCRQDGLITYR
jgi:broad specificity phosphatase PhoE